MDNGDTLHKWIKDLFPISRSIVGPGYDASLEYLCGLLDIDYEILEFKSGSKIQTWQVPDSWELRSATISDLNGNILVDSRSNNLHVWSHSVPVNQVVSQEELAPHLISLPDSPTAIPYATTYYQRNWGFSISENQRKLFNKSEYKVEIDSKLEPGALKVFECVLPGKSDSEIFFSTYLCHPSMANNELSGPALMTALIRHLAKLERRYTYRFVIAPETIGPIAYLSQRHSVLKSKILMAFNLTCVGDRDNWSLLRPREKDVYVDRLAEHLLNHEVKNWHDYSFADRGSDERQYSSPRVNMPMVSIMRSKYNCFPQYHNSLDDLNFVNPEGLQETLDFYQKLICVVENEGSITTRLIGEPFLSQTFKYPTVGGRVPANDMAPHKMANNLVAYADGSTVVDIANTIGISVLKLIPILNKCLDLGYIDRNFLEC